MYRVVRESRIGANRGANVKGIAEFDNETDARQYAHNKALEALLSVSLRIINISEGVQVAVYHGVRNF